MTYQEKLDIASEIFVLSTLGNTKNTIVVACEFRGHVDAQALEQAFRQALATYPHARSKLGEVWRWGQFYLSRASGDDVPLRFKVSDLPLPDESVPPFEAMIDRLRPTLDRRWDLFSEPPVRLELMRLADDRWLAAVIFHHSVGDGGTCTEISREILGQYHTIVTGQKPDWLFNPYVLSTRKKRTVPRKRITWRAAWNDFLTELRDMSGNSVMPAGNGTPGDLGEHHVKRVLSEADTLSLVQTGGKRGGPLVDRVVASMNRALDQWNELRGQPPGPIATAVTVSTKHRFESENDFINISALIFRSSPEDRADPPKFARSLSLARTKFFRDQADARLVHRITWITNRLRPLPLGLRKRLYHYVFERHRYSLSVTFMGVVWPGFENGRVTRESCLIRTGDAEIVEVHGTNYKPAAAAYANILCYVFRNRLNMVLTAAAAEMSHNDCREFLDLIVENLMAMSR